MLQNIRDNIQGLMAKIIIGLMVIPFAFFGVESLLGSRTGDIAVAEVNGEQISAISLERAVYNQKRRLLNQLGDQADPSLLDDSRLREPVLNQLIQKQLLLQAAAEANVDLAPEQVDQAIINSPQFQQDGQFSPQVFQNILRSNGFSPTSFKQQMKDDLVINQVNLGVASSDFSSERDLTEAARIIGQKRSFRYLTIPLDKVSDGIAIPEESIRSYYQDNEQSFQTADKVKLSYIEVRSNDFFKPVTEEAIREAYDLEMADFIADKERRASHILIETNDDRNDEQAKALIAELTSKLQSGADFAQLANEYSDDTGSATAGGDLGFTRGDTFPIEFEEALFTLQLNQVSSPVETESGYHLIKATEIKFAEKPDYEDRKEVLMQRLQLDEAEVAFVGAVEELKDLVFNSEDLLEPAKQLGLTVSQSDWLSSVQNEGVLSNPQVLAAAFSPEVLDEGNNSEVIELASDHYIVVRVAERDAPHTRPLDDVRADIRSLLVKDQAKIKAQAMAQQIKSDLGLKAMADIAKERSFSWQVHIDTTRNDAKVNREVLAQVFNLPVQGVPDITSRTTISGDVVVIQLDKVTEGDMNQLNKAELMSLNNEIQRSYANQSLNSFIQSLREAAEVTIL